MCGLRSLYLIHYFKVPPGENHRRTLRLFEREERSRERFVMDLSDLVETGKLQKGLNVRRVL